MYSIILLVVSVVVLFSGIRFISTRSLSIEPSESIIPDVEVDEEPCST